MELLSLEGTFGVLDGQKLTFSPGFTFFYLPNEAGKTTWTAFLRVMLYGLSTAARDSKSALADKNRYQPLSGQPMEGVLRVRREDGRVAVIHRFTNRAGPLQGFSAVYEDSGLPCADLTARDCGRRLTGLGEAAFLGCALVSGGDVTPGCDQELERKIAALAATGDSAAAYSRAREQLEGRRRQLRRNAKAGEEPQLLLEQQRLADQLDQLTRGQAQLAQWELQLRNNEKEKSQLRNQLEQTAASAQADARELAAQVECRHLEQEQQRLSQGLCEEAVLTGLEEQAARLTAAQAALERESEMQQAAEEQFSQRLEELFRRESQYRQALRERARYHVRWPALAAAALCSVLAVIAFFFPLGLPLLAPYEPAAFFVLFLLLLAVALDGLRGRPPEPESFDWEAEKQRLSQQRTQASQPRRQAQEAVDAQRAQLLTLAAALGRPLEDEGDVRRALAAAREQRRQWQQTTAALSAARDALAQAARERARSQDAAQPIRQALSQCQARSEDIRRRRDRLAGALQGLGSEKELRLRLKQTEDTLASVRQELAALALATQWLDSANEGIRARVSPAINRRAAEYLLALTGGAYDRVRIGQGLEAAAIPAGALAPRDRLRLSDGTRAQLYLALRLAVLDVVLPPAPAVPVILDDALLTFDEERLALALTVLRQVAQRRQIIVFSCRKEGKG